MARDVVLADPAHHDRGLILEQARDFIRFARQRDPHRSGVNR